jgi:hypothetical protein
VTVADYNAGIAPLLFLVALTQAAAAAPFAPAPSPAHARLFAPPHAAALYQFEVTAASIEAVAGAFREKAQGSGLRTEPGPAAESFTIASASILDVFDQAALYDRSRLARLYGGKGTRIARGPLMRNGRVVAAVLLVSPYPEPDLRHTNPGTLVMTVELARNADR